MVVLLSIDELKDRDLAGRVLWTGVELTLEEAEIVRKRAINAEGEATSRVVTRILKRRDPDNN